MKPSLRSGTGQETLPEVQDGSKVPPQGTGREAHLEVWEWAGGPFEGSRKVGKIFWRFETGREALLEVWNGLGGPPVVLGRVRCPSRRSGMGWEALLEVWDGLGGPPEDLGWVGRHFRSYGLHSSRFG